MAPPPAHQQEDQQPQSTGQAAQQLHAPQQQADGGSSSAEQAAAAQAGVVAAPLAGSAPPAGQAAGQAAQQDEVAMEVKGSADLEAEVALMLSGMNRSAMERPAPTDSTAAPSGSGAASGDAQLSAGQDNVPVLPDWVRNRDSRKDLPMVCHIVGCGEDLSSHPEYYQRYRICKMHLKSPALLVDGVVQRFCQQCGRFHQLKEFDGDKRNCRARLQQHNSRRRKVSALGQELRQARYGQHSQLDAGLVLPPLPGDAQWQWPSWQGAPSAGSLLPLSLSNGSLSGLEPITTSGTGNGSLPPLPGLALPLPPLPPPGAPPPPAHANVISVSAPPFTSAFLSAAGLGLQSMGGVQSMGQAPLTGAKRDYAAMLDGQSVLSASPAPSAAQQAPAPAPPPAPPATVPASPVLSTPGLLLDRMAQDALAAAAQQGQAQGPAAQWSLGSAAPLALQQHPAARPLVSLFPHLVQSVQQLSQQLQQARDQGVLPIGAPQLSVHSGPKQQQQQQQQQSHDPAASVTSALLKALLGDAPHPQPAAQQAQPQRDVEGAAAAASLAKAILANLQQQRQQLVSPPQQPPQAPPPPQPEVEQQQQQQQQPQHPALAVQQQPRPDAPPQMPLGQAPQHVVAVQPQPQQPPAPSPARSPQLDAAAGGSVAPDAVALLRALLQKHGMPAAGMNATAAPAAPALAPAPAAAPAQDLGSGTEALQRLAAALFQPAAPGSSAAAAAAVPAVAGSPNS